MPFADLHMHSTASDGTFNASQILELANQDPNINAIAITDHDTLDSSQEALHLAAAYPLDVICGIEITTRHDDRAVHMLGYFVDPSSASLSVFLQDNRSKREQRALHIAERLEDAGYPINPQDLLQTGACVNRPLLARLLVERGCASSVDDAFSRLIGSRSPYYVDAVYPDAVDAIRLIRDADGYAFIAHPARYRVVDLIPSLTSEGMAGLEAYHTQQTLEQSRELVKLAHELGLGISGGSDWHGDDVHAAKLGGAGLDESGYRTFLQTCDRA